MKSLLGGCLGFECSLCEFVRVHCVQSGTVRGAKVVSGMLSGVLVDVTSALSQTLLSACKIWSAHGARAYVLREVTVLPLCLQLGGAA